MNSPALRTILGGALLLSPFYVSEINILHSLSYQKELYNYLLAVTKILFYASCFILGLRLIINNIRKVEHSYIQISISIVIGFLCLVHLLASALIFIGTSSKVNLVNSVKLQNDQLLKIEEIITPNESSFILKSTCPYFGGYIDNSVISKGSKIELIGVNNSLLTYKVNGITQTYQISSASCG